MPDISPSGSETRPLDIFDPQIKSTMDIDIKEKVPMAEQFKWAQIDNTGISVCMGGILSIGAKFHGNFSFYELLWKVIKVYNYKY